MITKTKEQITAVIAHFLKRSMAEQYVERLKRAGFRDDEIGLIAPHDESPPTEEGTVAGAISGGALGAAAGAAATGMIPGIGPVLAVGILAGVLGGAVAGAATGGIVGGLIGMGVPEDEAIKYEREFLAGRSLVVVQAIGRGGEAIGILNELRAEEEPAAVRPVAKPLTPEAARQPYATKP